MAAIHFRWHCHVLSHNYLLLRHKVEILSNLQASAGNPWCDAVCVSGFEKCAYCFANAEDDLSWVYLPMKQNADRVNILKLVQHFLKKQSFSLLLSVDEQIDITLMCSRLDVAEARRSLAQFNIQFAELCPKVTKSTYTCDALVIVYSINLCKKCKNNLIFYWNIAPIKYVTVFFIFQL